MARARSGLVVSLRWTFAACALLIAAAAIAIWMLTSGLQHWTYDSLRREQARMGQLRADPVALRTLDGNAVQLWTHDGVPTVYVMDFIYTRCQSVCSVLGTEFQQMQRELQRPDLQGPAPVHLLSISFDPRDTPADLARYAKIHGATQDAWNIGRPFDPNTTRALLRQLGVVVVPDGRGDFVHNGALNVIDRTGRIRAVFDYADWEQALACAQALARGTPCLQW